MDLLVTVAIGIALLVGVAISLGWRPTCGHQPKFKPNELLEFVGAVKENDFHGPLLITSTGRALEFESPFDPLAYNKELFTCDGDVHFLLDDKIECVDVHDSQGKHAKFMFHFNCDHPVMQHVVVCGCGHTEPREAYLFFPFEKEVAVLERLKSLKAEVWAEDETVMARHPSYPWSGTFADRRKKMV